MRSKVETHDTEQASGPLETRELVLHQKVVHKKRPFEKKNAPGTAPKTLEMDISASVQTGLRFQLAQWKQADLSVPVGAEGLNRIERPDAELPAEFRYPSLLRW